MPIRPRTTGTCGFRRWPHRYGRLLAAASARPRFGFSGLRSRAFLSQWARAVSRSDAGILPEKAGEGPTSSGWDERDGRISVCPLSRARAVEPVICPRPVVANQWHSRWRSSLPVEFRRRRMLDEKRYSRSAKLRRRRRSRERAVAAAAGAEHDGWVAAAATVDETF